MGGIVNKQKTGGEADCTTKRGTEEIAESSEKQVTEEIVEKAEKQVTDEIAVNAGTQKTQEKSGSAAKYIISNGKLCIKNTTLAGKDLEDIRSMCKHADPITEISLSGCRLTATLVESLTSGILEDHAATLCTLQLENTQISDRGVEVIGRWVQQNHTLQALAIRLDRIGVDGITALGEALQNNSSLQTLDVSCSHIGTDASKIIAEALHYNSNLHTLNVPDNNIGWLGAKHLAKALHHNISLKTLNVSGNDIGWLGAESLAEVLYQNTSLQTLDVHGNLIYCKGAKAIAAALHHNTSLQMLDVNGNFIYADGAIDIAKALHHNSSLHTLDLGHNSIDSDGGKAIAEALHHNSSLHTLDLGHNSIHSDGGKAIAEALHHNSSLHTLKLNSNQIDSDGGKAIAEALHYNSSLHTLDLFHNSIHSDGGKAIAEALHHNSSLHTLDLGHNSIHSDGGKAIAEALHHNSSLHTLKLNSNQIDTDGGKAIAEALHYNSSLHTLDIGHNSIHSYGGKAIAEALHHNSSLHTLDISSNLIGTDDSNAIAEALHHNRSLQTSDISGHDTHDEKDITEALQQMKIHGRPSPSDIASSHSCRQPHRNYTEEQDVPLICPSDIPDSTRSRHCAIIDSDGIISEISDTSVRILPKIADTYSGDETDPNNLSAHSQVPEPACGSEAEADIKHHKDVFSFSRRFTTEGGVLQNPESDVVLTVPPGVVPNGETFAVNVRVHTDLLDYIHEVQTEDGCIIGPVVECLLNRTQQFQKPVTISIPLCRIPKTLEDIKVLFSEGNGFQNISSDSEMSFDINKNTVNVHTPHFTKFLVMGKKPVEVSDVLLSLGASINMSRFRSTAELRLMAHVNCHGLRDFRRQRKMDLPPNMDEIYTVRVCLPQRDTPVNFPTIHVDLEIEEKYEWDIKDHKKKVSKVVNGRNILYKEKMGYHISETVATFMLESKDRWEDVSFTMEVQFQYEPDIGNVDYAFAQTYPAPKRKQPTVCHIGIADNNNEPPIWSVKSPGALELLKYTPDGDRIKPILPELIAVLELDDDLWTELKGLGVVRVSQENRLKLNSTKEATTERFLEYLRVGPVWKFHAFLRALARVNDQETIQMLGYQALYYSVPDNRPEPPPATSQQPTPQLLTEPSQPPVWSDNSPGAMELLHDTSAGMCLNMMLPDLLQVVELDDLWPELKRFNVLTEIMKNKFTHNSTREETTSRFLEYLKAGPVWKFHAFLRALALVQDHHVIHMLGQQVHQYTEGCDSHVNAPVHSVM